MKELENNIKLYKELKSDFFNSLEMYGVDKYNFKDKFSIYESKYINDYYYNFANDIKLENKDEMNKISKEIYNMMISKKYLPVMYICSFEEENNYLDNNFKVVHTDSWMILDKLKYTKSKLSLNIRKIEDFEKDIFVNIMMDNYNSGSNEDPYSDLDNEPYKKALLHSFKTKPSKYNIFNYIVEYNNEIVGTISVTICENKACIEGVTVNSKYRKNNICSEMINKVVKDLEKFNVKYFYLQTEKGYYPEKVYQKLGFKNIFYGICYEIKK